MAPRVGRQATFARAVECISMGTQRRPSPPAGWQAARILSGSWRADPPTPTFTQAELASVEAELMASGSGGLAWWRIHQNPALRDTEVGVRFHDAFRLHALHAGLHKARIVSVLQAFHAGNIDPVLLKGWASAGLYPERGMRPFGDIDFWVAPQDLDRARAVVASLEPGDGVDLDHPLELSGSSITDMRARSIPATIDGVPLRVLADEDALRVCAIHFLAGASWRPLSLCDVAAALESRSPTFDWDLCLTDDRATREWVLAAIGLASRLLGASREGVPSARDPLPSWLTREVIRRWSQPWPARYHLEPLPTLAHPIEFARGLGYRWPTSMTSSIRMRVPPNKIPRLPIKIADGITRAIHYTKRPAQRNR